ncbi:MAG: hypothetical protein KIS73_24860 [Enhydrobacter sp.]|jgi:hypothetical protein|nr:hypothetical protein [Enhydrobacter sp.]
MTEAADASIGHTSSAHDGLMAEATRLVRDGAQYRQYRFRAIVSRERPADLNLAGVTRARGRRA